MLFMPLVPRYPIFKYPNRLTLWVNREVLLSSTAPRVPFSSYLNVGVSTSPACYSTFLFLPVMSKAPPNPLSSQIPSDAMADEQPMGKIKRVKSFLAKQGRQAGAASKHWTASHNIQA